MPPVQVGDKIKILTGSNRGRKAVVHDIDYLSQTGAYRDRYTVKMIKSGDEFDCVRECFILW